MLNRLIVAAVLLFAFAECQYSPAPSLLPSAPYGGYGGAAPYGAGYGGAAPYGAGYGGAAPYGGYGYGGYGYSRSYANSPIDQLSMGGSNFNKGNQGSGYLSNSPYGTYETPYMANPYPYQGSAIGTYDLYPRSYYELYGGLSQQGPPPPPKYSGGAPYGFYEPDTYASGLPPRGFNARPGPNGATPINGYKGAMAPNPFALVDPDDVPYISFQTQYKNNYGRKYDPTNISGGAGPAPPTMPTTQVPNAPGTNYYGINYGQNYGFNNIAPYRYNGYGQPPTPTTTAAPAPTTTTVAPGRK